jgi:hypothetical protein
VKKAEIFFVLKLVHSNYSFRSYCDIDDLCKAVFVDSEIASHMQLRPTKVHYMLLFGLAPYFKSLFLNDLKAGTGYMTLYCDEKTTRQVKKQLDIHIGYWSEKFKRTVVIYVHSCFLGHADADTLKGVILKFLDDNNLHASKLLHCSTDVPAVNKSLLKKFNDVFLEQSVKPLIDIGTCSLHPVHSGFHKDLDCLPFNIEQFANDLHSWFKLSAARRQDYDVVKLEELSNAAEQYLLRPVSSRRLTMEPVCQRIIDQFEPLKKYFLNVLPKSANSKASCTLDRYKRIKAVMEDSSTLAYLHFIVYLSSCVTPFLTLFQTEDPLVHILYDSSNDLVRSLMLKFMKRESVEGKTDQQLCDVKCDDVQNWLSLQVVEIGVGTRKALAAVAGEDTRKDMRRSFRKCLKTLCVYLQTSLPLANPVLRDISCLNPANRKTEDSRPAISRLCLLLSKVTETDSFSDHVTSEWLIYMCDTDP